MSFSVYNTPKNTDCSKKNPKKTVICEKNDIIDQNNENCVIFRSSITEKVQQVQISSHFYLMYLQLLCEVTEECF